jgi:division protein CdvB (Snf7/Vps24/ESCRT-III family)
MLRVGLEADLDHVVNQLAEEYGVERKEIRDDFEELVRELVQLKFVQALSDQGG